ncbi:MAG: DUF2190 family protein [Bacteroidetes bacterium]|nr:DUF2190 family protein [Bacteroidota bacterium]
MKTTNPGLIVTLLAAAALVKNRFIGFDGNYPSADGKSFGVVNDDTDSGYYATVVIDGIVLVEASAAITAGVAVTTTNVGKAKAVASTEKVNGYALDAASADGDLIRVQLK